MIRHDGREVGLLALRADSRNSDLRRCDVFLLRHLLNLIDQLLVLFKEILSEAGQRLAEITFGDIISASDLACQEA